MKNLYLIFTILFLLLSLAGGVFLVKNNQDNRNRAAYTYPSCTNGEGQLSCSGLGGSGCGGYGSCHAGGGYDSCYPLPGTNECLYTTSGGGQCQGQCPATMPSGYARCHCSNGVWTIGVLPSGGSCDQLCICTGNECTTCHPTNTPGNGPTNTPRSINTPTGTLRPTSTSTKTPTPTGTLRPTFTPTKTPTPTPTNTPTGTLTPTSTPTNTPTGTLTPSPTPTNTPTGTLTPTATPTNTPTGTLTPTSTPTNTPTGTYVASTPVPTEVLAQGPSPTRIVLPNSGVEFPAQVLTIIGVIVTLAGFLILL